MPVAISDRECIEKHSILVTESGCWIWMGHLDRCGYGKCKSGLAHRVSFETFVGPIPLGLEINHRCRVRCCVNPKHLEAISHHDNVKYGIRRPEMHRNTRKKYCPKSHPLFGENLVLRRWKNKISRGCRICLKEKQTRKYARRIGIFNLRTKETA